MNPKAESVCPLIKTCTAETYIHYGQSNFNGIGRKNTRIVSMRSL
jgi:hypothetical protein